MAMNINATRALVLTGQISAVTAAIEDWKTYSKRTGEDVSTIIAALTAELTMLTKMVADNI